MTPQKLASSSPKKKAAPVYMSVRFTDREQIETLRKAAATRGWSVNAFVVRVLQEAAKRVLESPPPPGIFSASSSQLEREDSSAA